MEEIIPVIAIIFTFGIPGVVIFWYLYMRHRERMRLIEKGVTPEEAKSYFKDMSNGKTPKPKNPYSSLKYGILLTFVGFGVAFANILSELYYLQEDIGIGVVLFFGGLGLLLYYAIVSAKLKKIKNEESESPVANQIK